MSNVKIMRADGEIEYQDLDREHTLDELQGLVGGLIEVVRMGDAMEKDHQMVVNEEGLLKGLSINALASLIAGQHIVGDAVLLSGKARMT